MHGVVFSLKTMQLKPLNEVISRPQQAIKSEFAVTQVRGKNWTVGFWGRREQVDRQADGNMHPES